MVWSWEQGVPPAPPLLTLLDTVTTEAPCIIISPVMFPHMHTGSMRSILERCASLLSGCCRVSCPSSSPNKNNNTHTCTHRYLISLSLWWGVGLSVTYALVCLTVIGCTHSRQWEWQEFTLLQSARAQVCHTHQHLLPSPQAFPCAR